MSVYRKLGIRLRTELARLIATDTHEPHRSRT
jgi:hypothetical protein